VHVDVHRPKAAGAVIRVAVASDPVARVRATEVFAGAREAPRQKAPRFVEPNGARHGDPSAGSPSRARASGRRSRYLLKVGLSGRCPFTSASRPTAGVEDARGANPALGL
jgi:hypothetical protein